MPVDDSRPEFEHYVDGRLDVLRQRLDDIDRATQLLNDTVNRTPTDIQREVSHLRELHAERLDAVVRETHILHQASEQAINKQEKAYEDRFAEMRRQIADLSEKIGKVV